MTNKESAGLLLYRVTETGIEVFLAHPGGPFWKNKDAGSWTIPKGEFTGKEEPLAAACREFCEETGYTPPGPFLPLTPVKQKSGKKVYAWAAEGDLSASEIVSNTFSLEWPPKSGLEKTFPEIDKGDWFDIASARIKINSAQVSFLDELPDLLNSWG